jgi:CRP-like cAMP-binding protein
MEMYKPFIENFIFFKDNENSDFIVKVVTSLKPLLSFKNDILIQEGDFIKEIFFVKKGVLSLDITIDRDNPQESINKYLDITEDGRINISYYVSSIVTRSSMCNLEDNFNVFLLKTKNEDKKIKEENVNLQEIKIIEIRKNEHFGDALMFLNERCPLIVRVRTKIAELLVLRKMEAIEIYSIYPNIWKKINKKSLFNMEQIKLKIKKELFFASRKYSSTKERKNLKNSNSLLQYLNKNFKTKNTHIKDKKNKKNKYGNKKKKKKNEEKRKKKKNKKKNNKKKREKKKKNKKKNDKKKKNEKREKKIVDNKKNESSRSNLMANVTSQKNTFAKLNTSQIDLQKSVNNSSTLNNQNISQKIDNGNTNKKEDLDDVQLNTDIILEKTENKGILQITIIIYIFALLFLVILVYFFVKIFVSLGFIKDIKNIFDDFGTVSYKYSMVYYYFNTIRVLLIVPKFTNEEIFETMTEDLIKETDNINKVLNYRMENYKSTAILFNAFSKKQSDTTVNIEEIICEDDVKCKWVLNSDSYNMVTDGIDVAINAMVQQTQNTYNDYKSIKLNTTQYQKDNMDISEVTKNYVDEKFKQVDINLNFVLSLVQERIYKAFLEDATSLKDKFQNQINIFNSLAIIYCVVLGIFVMIYVINKIKRMTNTVEVSTMRLNKAFCFIKENNLGNQVNSQASSFIV